MRRILRIWPLYFLVFYGLVVLTQFVPWAGAKDPGAWAAFTLFAGNWWICRHGWIPAYPVNPLWLIFYSLGMSSARKPLISLRVIVGFFKM